MQIPGSDLALGGAGATVLIGRTAAGWVITDDFDAVAVPGLERDAVPGAGGIRGGDGLDVDDDRVRDLAAVLLSAEAAGAAAWCVDTASAYAKVREQFGRPIGQFQAVKHRCAGMLVATELARAATWDAAASRPVHRRGGGHAASTPRCSARTTASRSSAGSASPGSTTRTCT